MNLGLSGKFALVTGGSHGIGRSIALSLANEGCNVAVCARNRERVERVEDEIKSWGANTTLGISADATILSDVERVMEIICKEWGRLHILINNVGGGGVWNTVDIENNPESLWQEVYEKNTLSAIRFTMLAFPFIKKKK